MRSIALIQARLSSSRLPAKVLLPIENIPLVVLAAKRASNTGIEVLVVTSTDVSDDMLCDELKKKNIKYYRGSLNNTLNRFVSALKEFDDQTIVFRLTADNSFPDGSLLDELEENFKSQKLDYLICNGHKSGLPHGLSAEVMRLSALREASVRTEDLFDLEHVTPYLRRKFGESYYEKYKTLHMGAYSCGIDIFDDYVTVANIFSKVDNPITVHWKELLKVLKKNDDITIVDSPVEKLVLGGAQLGLNYGINNTAGKPSNFIADRLIKKAISNGVKYIDTAREYGDSENLLGEILQKGWETRVNVITKLSLLNECDEHTKHNCVINFVKASVFESCQKIRTNSLYCLMLHRVSHIYDWDGVVWQQLLRFQKDGIIKKLGASVQSPEELALVLKLDEIEFIQMPFNILDSRWDIHIEQIKMLKKKRKLIIHTRSPLLQGLLTSSETALWKTANVKNSTTIIEWLNKIAQQHDYKSVVSLALNYVKSHDWVDGIVVGMEAEKLLDENLKFFSNKCLTKDELLSIKKSRPILSEATLNPTNWRV